MSGSARPYLLVTFEGNFYVGISIKPSLHILFSHPALVQYGNGLLNCEYCDKGVRDNSLF